MGLELNWYALLLCIVTSRSVEYAIKRFELNRGCVSDRQGKSDRRGRVVGHPNFQALERETGINASTLKLRWGRGKRGEALLAPTAKSGRNGKMNMEFINFILEDYVK